MGNRVAVTRAEAAKRLEVLAASLRSGLIDADDVHARIPDQVQLDLSVEENAIEMTLVWGLRAPTRDESPTAEGLFDRADEAVDANLESREEDRIHSADDAVVRDAREGRLP